MMVALGILPVACGFSSSKHFGHTISFIAMCSITKLSTNFPKSLFPGSFPKHQWWIYTSLLGSVCHRHFKSNISDTQLISLATTSVDSGFSSWHHHVFSYPSQKLGRSPLTVPSSFLKCSLSLHMLVIPPTYLIYFLSVCIILVQ